MSAVTTDTGPFAMVPEWLLFSGVSGNAVKLFATLHRFENPKTDGVYPSRKTLAGLMKVSQDTVDRALKELVTAGAVTTEARFSEDGDRTANLYHLHFARVPSRESAATGSRESAATGGGTDAAVTREDLNERSLKDTHPSDVKPSRKNDAEDRNKEAEESSGKARRGRGPQPLTDEQRQRIIQDHPHIPDVSAEIDAALNHTASLKCKDLNLYVRTWLRRWTPPWQPRSVPAKANRWANVMVAAGSENARAPEYYEFGDEAE